MKNKEMTVIQSMEEMKSIALERMKNTAHREFVNDTLIEARKCEALTRHLARQLEALEAAYGDEMQASLIEDEVQRLTQEVYDLSEQRSQAQTALKSALRGVMGLVDAQKVAAATVLFELMHKYDLHTGMNVDEQTAVIDSFLLDVDEQHLEQMEQAGQMELYVLLKQLNQRVCDKVIERDQAKVGLGTSRMQNARQATDSAWRDLRRGVNAYAYVDGYEGFAAFIGYMNVLIIRYKRTHLGQSAESPEAEPGDTEETPPSDGSDNGGTGGSGSGSGSNGEPSNPGDDNNGTGGGSDNGGSTGGSGGSGGSGTPLVPGGGGDDPDI